MLVRIHMTNIIGLGAVRLMQSLLPSIIGQKNFFVEEAYLPSSGEMANFRMFDSETKVSVYVRYLPKAMSRVLECTLLGRCFDGTIPLLVFGDIPIRCNSRQTVFIQSPLLVKGANSGGRFGGIKYWILRWLFQKNLKYASKFIVQTEAMRSALIDSYPEISGRIEVVAQPAPSWLIKSKLKRKCRLSSGAGNLHLFYPAAFYPHKNHKILCDANTSVARWPIADLILTIPENINPNPHLAWIRCVGKLDPEKVVEIYRNTDGIIFLSLSESFGFPLVEAMWVGLPIVCPDLPYARVLCGDLAFYFDPNDVVSLHRAVEKLSYSLGQGWWPDWSENLKKIPQDWDEVAVTMLKISTQ